MLVIAHRGNIVGKTDKENTLEHLLKAAKQGFGVEIDLRRASDNKKPIISHDPAEWTPENDAETILCALGDTFIALNVKEPGLYSFAHGLYKNVKRRFNGFVFDFELLTYSKFANAGEEIFHWQRHGFPIARRYSDRDETPSFSSDYIWLDEMDKSGSLDLSGYDLSKMIYVSPELHGRDPDEARLEQFFAVCADRCDYYHVPTNLPTS